MQPMATAVLSVAGASCHAGGTDIDCHKQEQQQQQPWRASQATPQAAASVLRLCCSNSGRPAASAAPAAAAPGSASGRVAGPSCLAAHGADVAWQRSPPIRLARLGGRPRRAAVSFPARIAAAARSLAAAWAGTALVPSGPGLPTFQARLCYLWLQALLRVERRSAAVCPLPCSCHFAQACHHAAKYYTACITALLPLGPASPASQSLLSVLPPGPPLRHHAASGSALSPPAGAAAGGGRTPALPAAPGAAARNGGDVGGECGM